MLRSELTKLPKKQLLTEHSEKQLVTEHLQKKPAKLARLVSLADFLGNIVVTSFFESPGTLGLKKGASGQKNPTIKKQPLIGLKIKD